MNKSHSKQLKCLQINLRHCKAASAALSQLICELDLDLIFIQEPYANQERRISDIPPRYTTYHLLNENHAYGAAIIYKSRLKITPLPKLTTNEIAAIEVSCGTTKIKCFSAYCRPTEENPNSFLSTILQAQEFHADNSLLCMDSNSHNTLWNSERNDLKGTNLEDLFLTNELNVCNIPKSNLDFVPTATSFIDITVAGDSLVNKLENWRYLNTPSLSDHHYIYFSVNLHPSYKKSTRLTLPKPDAIDVQLGNTLLKDRLQPPITLNTEDEIEQAIANLTSSLSTAIKDAAKPKEHTQLHRKMPWWNKDLYRIRQELRKALKLAETTNDPLDLENAASLKTQYQREIRKAKAFSWKKFCTEEINTDPFKAIKKLNHPKRQLCIPELRTADGRTTTSDSEILNLLAETFFPKLNDQATQRCQPTEESVPVITGSPAAPQLPPLTNDELSYAISSLKKNKAPGHDGITAEHIHLFRSSIEKHLYNIIESCLRLAYFPTAWKVADVLIIPKANKSDYSAPSSYRPISLLPTMSKILEKVILRRMLHYSSQQNWLNTNQHGFRSDHSTVTAINALKKQIDRGFRAKAYTVCIFLDIKGAFDNAQHDTILTNLREKGCPFYILQIIRSFLSSRSANLQINDSKTNISIEKGCPQGSTLSPLLWNIVVDEALNLPLPPGVRIQAYADDLVILITGLNEEAIQNNLQKACNALTTWGKSVCLDFSAEKTEFIVFTRKRKQLDLTINVNGIAIKSSPNVKYLGVILDSKLNWRKHVEEKCKQTKCTITTLRRFTKLTWGPDRKILAKLFNSIAEPKLLYAVPVWIEATSQRWCINKLRSIQRMMLITTIRSFKTISTKSTLVLANSLPIEKRAIEIATQYALNNGTETQKTIQDLLRSIDVDLKDILPKTNSYLAQAAPYDEIAIKVNTLPEQQYPDLLPPSENHRYIFTDGSKTDNNVGFASIITSSKGIDTIIRARLASHCNIFEAEAHAIHTALKAIAKENSTQLNISVFTDSKSVLQALKLVTKTIPVITETQQLLIQLQRKHLVSLFWIPGHRGIAGNEVADNEAKYAANDKLLTITKTPIMWPHIKPRISTLMFEQWNNEWISETTTSSTTKLFFPSIQSANVLRTIHTTHQLIQLMSGHSKLNCYLHKIKVKESDTCENCDKPETVEHFLYNCDKFQQQRYTLKNFCIQHLKTWPPPLHLLVSDTITLKALKTYVTTTKRLEMNDD